jgi:hypothetical protein
MRNETIARESVMHGMTERLQKTEIAVDGIGDVCGVVLHFATDGCFAQGMRGGQANTRFLSAYDTTTRGEEMFRL